MGELRSGLQNVVINFLTQRFRLNLAANFMHTRPFCRLMCYTRIDTVKEGELLKSGRSFFRIRDRRREVAREATPCIYIESIKERRKTGSSIRSVKFSSLLLLLV